MKTFKRKRVKTHTPQFLRCKARRANGEQCTRSRRNGCEYCLSHQKSLPHGRIDDNNYVKKVKGKRGRKKKTLGGGRELMRIIIRLPPCCILSLLLLMHGCFYPYI